MIYYWTALFLSFSSHPGNTAMKPHTKKQSAGGTADVRLPTQGIIVTCEMTLHRAPDCILQPLLESDTYIKYFSPLLARVRPAYLQAFFSLRAGACSRLWSRRWLNPHFYPLDWQTEPSRTSVERSVTYLLLSCGVCQGRDCKLLIDSPQLYYKFNFFCCHFNIYVI